MRFVSSESITPPLTAKCCQFLECSGSVLLSMDRAALFCFPTEMEPGDDPDYQRITLRIPRGLHERLMTAAKVGSKSMNAEVIGRLEASFTDVADRLNVLEKAVLDDEMGNQALFKRILDVQDEFNDKLDYVWQRNKGR